MIVENIHQLEKETFIHRVAALVALGLLLPLFVTPILPLVDFYSHIVRYYILAGNVQGTELAADYIVSWKVLPNLGMDVLGTLMLMYLPPLFAAKLLAAVIVLAPYFGVLTLAYCLHGRITILQVALASICSFNLVLNWGFANFLLGFSLALASLGFWIAQRKNPSAQLATAILMGLLIVIVHGLVFAVWGLLLFSCELGHTIQQKNSLQNLAVRTCRLLAIAALPVSFFLFSNTVEATGGLTKSLVNFQNYIEKDLWLERLLQEGQKRLQSMLGVAETVWFIPDLLFGAVLWGGLTFLFVRKHESISNQIFPAILLSAFFVVAVPPNLFDVGHLDERFPLLLLCLVAAGIAPNYGPSRSQLVSYAVPILAILHLSMVTYGWYQVGRSYREFISAVHLLPAGGYVKLLESDTSQIPAGDRFCKPLASIVFLLRHSAVDTFSNASHQPLEIVGKLKLLNEFAATHRKKGVGVGAEADEMISGGFDKVVLCGTDLRPGSQGTNVAEDNYWMLLQK